MVFGARKGTTPSTTNSNAKATHKSCHMVWLHKKTVPRGIKGRASTTAKRGIITEGELIVY